MAAAVGFISGVIGIVQFLGGLIPNRGATNVCNVRVAAALNGNGLSAADGSISRVKLFNLNQQIIGNTGGGYSGSGGFRDISVSQTNNQQSAFVQLEASNDAICIPYASTTWVDGSKYAWVGDWGQKCGLDWYYGNVYVDNSNTKPLCTWIDGDHTNGIKAGMIMIHWPSFAGGKPLGNNVANYCGYPAFRAYRDTNGGGGIFTRDEGEDEPEGLQLARNVDEIEKTSGPVKHAFDSRLVISSEPTHNATALCESTTSRGPDFVSLFEGVYCNMATSETLPLCVEGTLTEGCFHVENQASVGKRAENATEPVVVEKEYTAVIRWD